MPSHVASTTDALLFEVFYAANAARLHTAVLFVVGEPAAAADALQEAMARAFERWDDLRAGPNPAGWVYRSALNVSRHTWRRRVRERELLVAVPDRAPERSHADAMAVAAALRQLRMPLREVAVARFYLQFTPTEIAEALDLPTGTVKSRLHRAGAELRRHLEDGR